VDASAAEIADVARRTRITHVQLHGQETPELAAAITGVQIIKAFRVREAATIRQAADWLSALAPGDRARTTLLLDAYDPRAAGGTGRTFNWQLIRQARRDGTLPADLPIILAGGLTPENVRQAVAVAGPWGVDVASGVESAPGVKDLGLVEAFIAALADA
jgi:phosphoribosylanthranilate isomerase